MSGVSTRVITSFDDPAVRPEIWSQLQSEGDTDVASLTWQAQRAWWHDRARLEGLMLIMAEEGGQPKAIAPLFAESGMAINLCPVNYLDMVGDVSDSEVLDAMLRTASRHVAGFVGIRFYFVPDRSRTGGLLQKAAERLGWNCYLEDDQPSPIIDLRGKPEAALRCTQQATMLRRERQLQREGRLEITHFRDASEILPQLDEFFRQHIARWANTPTPSKFGDPAICESFRQRTVEAGAAGSLRFSRLSWNGRAIAFHRGTSFKGHYKYGRTTFDPDLAQYSPGTVLLRHVLLSAIEENAHTFDFGLGDEAYKYRYATDEVRLQTWGLYDVRVKPDR
jgi:CelD/BcsL family acetyltransferase involved in cellulose biosynthesis